jgi:hypothetical protein
MLAFVVLSLAVALSAVALVAMLAVLEVAFGPKPRLPAGRKTVFQHGPHILAPRRIARQDSDLLELASF